MSEADTIVSQSTPAADGATDAPWRILCVDDEAN
ncbi:MAG: hypothetical protein QG672_1395, partial [Pseudomonadota bacterium]|nr:hypothetical protein [Pseudomonadota bacterium]